MQDKISLKNRFVNEVLQFLPNRIKQSLIKTDTNILTELEEIRLRSGKPAFITCITAETSSGLPISSNAITRGLMLRSRISMPFFL